jgi:hypothetical protein
MAPESELATLTGTVRDRDGFLLRGATIFAFFGTGGSARAFSDNNGKFVLRDLVANVNYAISASGQSFRSDQTNIVLGNGETRNLNFTLDNPGLPALSPPQNIGITSWVSFPGDGRSVDTKPIDWAKSHLDKGKDRKFVARSRAIRSDKIVEAEMFWDGQQFADLFGFGVYRAPGFNGALQALDFYFDPLAPYYQDVGLNANSSYSYALTTISTLFPDYGTQTESNLSDRIGVYTLDLLRLTGVTGTANTPIFNWQSGSGADEFIVYIFDRYPDLGIEAIWSNENNPSTGTSASYTGPALESGRTYYYLVLGSYDFFTARTISQVETFIR